MDARRKALEVDLDEKPNHILPIADSVRADVVALYHAMTGEDLA